MLKRKIRFRISRAVLSDLNEENKKILRKMTLQNYSMMKSTLDYTLVHEKTQIALAHYKDQNLGWALKRPWRYGAELIMVYVKPQFRRNGVGTALVESFKDRRAIFKPWDDRSEAFFKTMR